MKAPLLIRIFCWIFAFISTISVGLVIIVLIPGAELGATDVSFLTVSATHESNPVVFFSTIGLFLFAGVVSFLILFRNPSAYTVGIAYCLTSLSYLLPIGAIQSSSTSEAITEGAGVSLTYGAFLAYLFFRQREWRQRNRSEQIPISSFRGANQ